MTEKKDVLLNEKQPNLLAYVSDPISAKAISHVIKSMNMMDATVLQEPFSKALSHLASKRSPKILIVDLSNSDLPISDIQTLAEVCEPGVEVIALGERNDVGLFRELLQMGIRDYLVKPINVDIMSRCLKKVLDPNSETSLTNATASRTGKIVVFSGTRGGVGTTTLACNTAWVLANEKNRRVALVDLDLQYGTSGMLLDLKPGRGLREALENPNRIDPVYLDRIMVKQSERLSVLNSEEALEEELDLQPGAMEVLLETLAKQYHYVIVDASRLLNPETRTAFRLANTLVSISEFSMPALRDGVRLANLFTQASKAKRIINVINRDHEYKEGALTREEYEQALGFRIHHIIGFDQKHAMDSLNLGKPAVTSKGILSSGIYELVSTLIGSQDLEQSSKPFWKKLFGR